MLGGTLLWLAAHLCPAQTLCWHASAPPDDFPGMAPSVVQIWSHETLPFALLSVIEQLEPRQPAAFTVIRLNLRLHSHPNSFKLWKTMATFFEAHETDLLSWLEGGCYCLSFIPQIHVLKF